MFSGPIFRLTVPIYLIVVDFPGYLGLGSQTGQELQLQRELVQFGGERLDKWSLGQLLNPFTWYSG